MGAPPCHMTGDLGQMLCHGAGIAPRHDESRRLAELWADRAEDVGRSRALIVWCRRPRSTLGPAACDLVLLANAGFVLEPDFYSFPCAALAAISATAAGNLFKSFNRLRVLRMMFRARREFAKAHGVQLATQCPTAHRDAIFLPKPLRQIGKTTT